MSELACVLTDEEIAERVARIAERISSDYADGDLVVVGVLKGAFIFMADLCRKITVPHTMDFVRVASYGSSTESCGTITLDKELELDITDKDVLIVEDIVDSGLTIDFLFRHLKQCSPRSLALCALIDKTERRECSVDIKYACHQVPSGFLVGYGLDFDEQYRGLPGIYEVKPQGFWNET